MVRRRRSFNERSAKVAMAAIKASSRGFVADPAASVVPLIYAAFSNRG
jgi:hypothetical protein